MTTNRAHHLLTARLVLLILLPLVWTKQGRSTTSRRLFFTAMRNVDGHWIGEMDCAYVKHAILNTRIGEIPSRRNWNSNNLVLTLESLMCSRTSYWISIINSIPRCRYSLFVLLLVAFCLAGARCATFFPIINGASEWQSDASSRNGNVGRVNSKLIQHAIDCIKSTC